MAQNTVPVLSFDFLPQLLSAQIERVNAILQTSELSTCAYDEEGYDCHQLGTVCHLERETDYCLKHFEKVERHA